MIDPIIKSDLFLSYLKSLIASKSSDENTLYKINNFDQLPNHVIVLIHLNINLNDIINDNIVQMDKLTKQNTKSRLMIHVNVSHMIHYKIPHVVIDSIKNL